MDGLPCAAVCGPQSARRFGSFLLKRKRHCCIWVVVAGWPRYARTVCIFTVYWFSVTLSLAVFE